MDLSKKLHFFSPHVCSSHRQSFSLIQCTFPIIHFFLELTAFFISAINLSNRLQSAINLTLSIVVEKWFNDLYRYIIKKTFVYTFSPFRIHIWRHRLENINTWISSVAKNLRIVSVIQKILNVRQLMVNGYKIFMRYVGANFDSVNMKTAIKMIWLLITCK